MRETHIVLQDHPSLQEDDPNERKKKSLPNVYMCELVVVQVDGRNWEWDDVCCKREDDC